MGDTPSSHDQTPGSVISGSATGGQTSGGDGRAALLRRWASRAMIAAGFLLLLLWTAAWAEDRFTEAIEGRRLEAALAGVAESPAPGLAPPTGEPVREVPEERPPPPEPGDLIGRLDVPRLGVSAIVLSGLEPGTLRRAAGHVPRTSLPGEGGNVAVAGHRDRHFAGLGEAETGDEITFSTPGGVHRYRVIGTEVVEPRDVRVLDDRGREELTLVTCHPFNYLGPAPNRFIVYAEKVGEEGRVESAGLATPPDSLALE